MKLVLLLLLPLALIECQHPYYSYYYPRYMNPLVHYNQMSYQAPYNLFRYFDQPQQSVMSTQQDDQDELLGENYVISPASQAQFRANPFVSSNGDLPMARFFFNQANGGLITGSSTSTFNFALKTLVQTTVATRTVLTTALCIPATAIGYATTCSRRRRDIESILVPVEPSPIEKVETTAYSTQPLSIADAADEPTTPFITSSKANDDAELEDSASGPLQRARRFFIARTTFTSFVFATSTLKRPVTINIALNGGPGICPPGPRPLNCLLSCIPPGYVVC